MRTMNCGRFPISGRKARWAAALLGAALLWPSAAARAQMVPAPAPLNLGENVESGDSASRQDKKPPQLEGVGIVEKLHKQVPLGLTFKDANGKTVKLGDYFHKGEPVLLDLGYYSCPMLCPQIWTGMADVLKKMDWVPGKQFQIVTLSIDPRDTPKIAKEKKDLIVKSLDREVDETGWHFLVGQQTAIEQVAKAVGFNYRWDPQTQQYNHQAALIILSPDGKVMRYLYGIRYNPTTLKYSLIDASQGQVGSTIEKLILYCCQYDPSTGKYTWIAMKVMQLGGGLTMLLLGGSIGFMLLLEARKRKALAARQAVEANHRGTETQR